MSFVFPSTCLLLALSSNKEKVPLKEYLEFS